MRQKYSAQGLAIVSIHSPEFDWEKSRETVIRYAQRFKLEQAIYLDNDHSYWRALSNRYWPAFYLVDQQGQIRRKDVGEMHAGQAQADSFEREVQRLLREK